jgi:hypothetical protein
VIMKCMAGKIMAEQKMDPVLFVEVCCGVKRKTPPEMINSKLIPKWLTLHEGSEQGLYTSIYAYPTQDPYIGYVISDFYLDLDCEENPNKARKEAVAIVRKLISDYAIQENAISIAFSGMKGFSITIDQRVFSAESCADLPLIWKSMAQDLATQLKLKTIDTGIYDRRRLWRLLNSKHQKTGLYKIPLTLPELEKLKIDEIRKKATKSQKLFTRTEAHSSPKANQLFLKHKTEVAKWATERKRAFGKAVLTTIDDDPPCVKRLLKIGAKKGQRNTFTFEVAVYFAAKGLLRDDIMKICHAFSARFPEPLTNSELESLVDSAIKGVKEKRYSVGCTSEALVDLCDKPNCPFFKKSEPAKANYSAGQNLESKIFEQISDQQYIVYDKDKRITRKQKQVDGFKPLSQLLWEPVEEIEEYISEQTLFDDMKQFLYNHLDLTEGYDTIAAWVLASWSPEKWHAVPYLFFFGSAGSGKTWALEVLKAIGFRPFLSSSATLASIFRVIDQWHPTMLFDETEAYMKKDRAEIVHMLNAGYRKGCPAVRVEETKDGYVPKAFDVFGFKALAGTKEFINTLGSRCIIFSMSKACRKTLTMIDAERATSLRRKLLLYRFKKLSDNAKPEPPDVLTGRLKELFESLLVVAPAAARGAIMAHAKRIEESNREEEQASSDALVAKAILQLHGENQSNKITIEEIGLALNENLAIDEQLSSVAIGRICRKLGFKGTLRKGKRAVFWNSEVARRLSRRYGEPKSRLVTD